MSPVSQALRRLEKAAGCSLLAPTGPPPLQLAFPEDLAEFYSLCGGAILFGHSLFPLRISAPCGLVESNVHIIGDQFPDDPSSRWYVIASAGQQVVSIDFSATKFGYCYDSFWDRHAVAGSCPTIALSFTEFLSRSLDADGENYYWLTPTFSSYGDAYD